MTPNRPRHAIRRPPRTRRGHRGFTLIEILVVVAIIGILAAIALPSYGAYVTKTRRTDATIFLMEVAGEQQRHFSDNNRYAEKMTELGYAGATSPEGHYAVTIDRPSLTRFTLTATPVAGGSQANDAECTALTLDSTGGKGATGTGGRDGCW